MAKTYIDYAKSIIETGVPARALVGIIIEYIVNMNMKQRNIRYVESSLIFLCGGDRYEVY